jgi:sugar phosphate isomerase/epimerase
MIGYCANVHPGETLADVLRACQQAGAVRRRLGWPDLGFGLWLGRSALSELRTVGSSVLRDALAEQALSVYTLNGFPYGNFHSDVVKRAVYHPDWTSDLRRGYTLELAEVLIDLLPRNVDVGTISTLPIAHYDEADAGTEAAAALKLCLLADALARLADRSGKCVRVCLEPEPGCLLERTPEAVRFFTQTLRRSAQKANVAWSDVQAHLGICFDTCHQAVVFEDARASLTLLREAGMTVGKMQLSSALVVHDPIRSFARLLEFDEPRFLHQVRTSSPDGGVLGADDLPLAVNLPREQPWRVHFHVPIHRPMVGDLGTTQEFLQAALSEVCAWPEPPHLEVETYTWSVLPEAERPDGESGLLDGIADELRWVEQILLKRGSP